MIKDYIQSNQQRFLDELFDLLRIPSVSADSRHKTDVPIAATKPMYAKPLNM